MFAFKMNKLQVVLMKQVSYKEKALCMKRTIYNKEAYAHYIFTVNLLTHCTAQMGFDTKSVPNYGFVKQKSYTSTYIHITL